ncbi:SPW repeat domain-containing protein [Natronococcus occultus]|uniref:SPW repeat-containing integral membrane domain-containing protein n=1 Tax=Natronococcus occultus SP4 TaxID=694430 RepID=L0JXU5_9EURY|nr:SPW repeat protein [Natronococcus occultus]AGB37842.1 hypothetical protein Natoc_2056 [Natronococcus occultus SP4]
MADTDGEDDSRRLSEWLANVTVALALWIAVSPIAFDAPEAAMWNNAIVGLGIVMISAYNETQRAKGERLHIKGATVVVALGLWAIVSPFVSLLLDGGGWPLWSNVLGGLGIVGCAGYNVYISYQLDELGDTVGGSD